MKKVSFNNIVVVRPTYSSNEYSRKQIESTIYKKIHKIISDQEWLTIQMTLDIYKLYEMKVHNNSICNNSYNKFLKHQLKNF